MGTVHGDHFEEIGVPLFRADAAILVEEEVHHDLLRRIGAAATDGLKGSSRRDGAGKLADGLIAGSFEAVGRSDAEFEGIDGGFFHGFCQVKGIAQAPALLGLKGYTFYFMEDLCDL